MKKIFLAFAFLPFVFGGCMKLFDSDQTAVGTIQTFNPTQPSGPSQPSTPTPSGGGTTTGADNGSGTGDSGGGTDNGGGGSGGGSQTVAAPGDYTKVGTKSINGVDYDIVTFGLWPQTIKANGVNVDNSCESKVIGAFTGYKGSDGEWYVSVWERAYHSSCKYSNGEFAGLDSYHRYRWFKVEPIKWRVLTNNYNGTGKKLLLAEDVFMLGSYYDCYDSNYNGYTTRKIDGKSVLPGNYEHSRVRAGLNGLAYQIKEDYRNSIQHEVTGLVGKGFLKFAFTAEEQAQISVTNLDIVSGEGDKIFLLNSQEVVNADYGFNSGAGKYPTDYAIACGAYRNYQGWGFTPWWLRCVGTNGGSADAIGNDGKIGYGRVNRSDLGIVPALCVEN